MKIKNITSANEWKNYSQRTIELAELKSSKDAQFQQIKRKIQNTNNLEFREALSLCLLPYLLLPKHQKKNQTIGKFSRLETQEAFAVHFEVNNFNILYVICVDNHLKIFFFLQNQSEADANFEEFKLRCLSQGQSIQPRLHFIGSPVTVSEVIVVDKKYIYYNALEALEVCFHFFTALNIEYPVAAEQVWTVVAELIFNIKSFSIKGSTRTLLNSIKKPTKQNV